MAKTESIDIVFSFDTTGSMFPCLTQVRNKVSETIKRLFKDIPNLRVGIIAHGDYYDGARAITKFDFSDDQKAICKFVETVQATNGGDTPECYELVLHEARSLAWSAGKNKALVLIGDDIPHPPSYPQNTKKLDWKNELKLLVEAGIHVHAVQALARGHATSFYEKVAEITGGCHLELHQFAHVVDLLMAICYKQSDPEQLQQYEQEVSKQGRMNRSVHQIFSTLLGRKISTSGGGTFGKVALEAVHPSRFQVLDVEKDVDIAGFVRSEGLTFKLGRGFYQFIKPVEVQDHKEVILVDKKTGDMFSGAKARELLRLPKTGTVRIKPDVAREVLANYTAFIQSTSVNRKLLAGTKFLYEVDDWDRAEAA
jgi:hypothetical protein